MRINLTGSIQAVERYRGVANNAINRSEKSQQSDRVEISSEAASFHEIFKAAKASMEEPVMPAQDLSALKQQISSGSYQVDDAKLAEAILFSVRV